MPRFEPYSALGIKRVPCTRCGAPSQHQWNICMDKVKSRTQYRGLCLECDIGLNEVAAKFVFGDTPETATKIETYRIIARKR